MLEVFAQVISNSKIPEMKIVVIVLVVVCRSFTVISLNFKIVLVRDSVNICEYDTVS